MDEALSSACMYRQVRVVQRVASVSQTWGRWWPVEDECFSKRARCQDQAVTVGLSAYGTDAGHSQSLWRKGAETLMSAP